MIECSNCEEWFHLKCDHSESKENWKKPSYSGMVVQKLYISACNCMIDFRCILLMLELELMV